MIKPTLFYNINPNVLDGLTYWFKLKEIFLALLYLFTQVVTTKESWKQPRFYVFLLLYPVAIAIAPIDALGYDKRIKKAFLEDEDSENMIPVFNKKNVEYMKMMTLLSGGEIYDE